MGRGRRLVVAAVLALGMAAVARSGSVSAVPADDWTSDLTECVWTNGVTTSCSLTMSSPVSTVTISGTNTNTTKELLSGTWAILARHFDSNLQTLGFVTDANGGRLASLTFKHVHNHNAGQAPGSYGVQLEVREGAGAWSNFGSPFTADSSTSTLTQTVTAASEVVLLPNTTYSIRWNTTANGATFSDVTKADFFAVGSLTVGFRKYQTLSVTQAADGTVGGTVALAGTVSSGLPITWSSATPGVCSVTGASASLLTAGTCTVSATQTGDAVWVPSTAQTMSFNVAPAATTTTAPPTTTTSTTIPATTTTVDPALSASAGTTTVAPFPAPTTLPSRVSSAAPAPVTPRAPAVATTTTLAVTNGAVPVPATSTTTVAPVSVPAPSPAPVVDSSSSPFRTARSTDRFFGVALAAAPSGGTTLTGTAAGLSPGSVVTVVLQPGSVSVGTATVAADGTTVLDVQLPASFDPSTSRVELRGTSAAGEEIGAVGVVPESVDGTELSAAAFGEFIGVLPAVQLERSADTGLPVYDTLRNVGDTVALTTSATIVAALALGGLASGAGRGARGGRRTPGGRGDRLSDSMRVRGGRRRDEGDDEEGQDPESSEGEVGGTDANLLDANGADRDGRGDRSISWRLPGTALLQRIVESVARWAEHRSVLLTRTATDGQWARASLGSAGALLWLVGAVVGAAAAVTPGGDVVRLTSGFACVLVALALLDAAAGAFAFLGFALVNIAAGNVGSLFDARTLLGVALLLVALPSIGSAIRPFRRTVEGRDGLLDRAADYLIAPLFLGYAGSSAYAALNGLSGLDMVSSAAAVTVRNVVFVMTVVRLVLEDAVPLAYPRRIAETTIEVEPEPSVAVRSASVVTVGALYLLGAGPFYGYGWQTWAIVSLLVLVPALGEFSHLLPNSARAHRVIPRGVLRSVVMCYVGAWFASVVMSAAGSAVSARSIAVVLLLPGVVLGVVDCFAREGGDWPDNAAKRAGGLVLWAVSALILVGVITP
ncbi:MAG: hypothetical protein ACKOFF_06685 [Acidimicrobiales bacterium]